jgi:hypothetical protein
LVAASCAYEELSALVFRFNVTLPLVPRRSLPMGTVCALALTAQWRGKSHHGLRKNFPTLSRALKISSRHR